MKGKIAEYLWEHYGNMYGESIEDWLEDAEEILAIIQGGIKSRQFPRICRSRILALLNQ